MAVIEQVSIGSLAQGAVPPGYTFTRSTAALYVDSDGLLKWSAHNLLTYSEDWSNAAWTKTGCTINANASTAPDGTTTADEFVETADSSAHQLGHAASVGARVYTYSCYVKKRATRHWVRLMVYDGGATFTAAYFDLDTGLTGTVDSPATASMESVGNGWYRCSMVLNGTFGNVYIHGAAADGGVDTYAGSTSEGFYLWGAQLNYGSTATAYLPTTSAARYDSPRRQWDATNRRWGYVGEGERTNRLTYSEDFRDTTDAGSSRPWVYSAVAITVNAATSPDGATTADKIVGSAANTIHEVRQLYTVSAIAYSASVFFKAAEYTWGFINYYDGTADRQAFFNLSTGVVGTVSAGTTAGIVSYGNGWYRCHITVTGVVASNRFDFGVTNADNARIVALNGTSGIYLWGAQLEAGPAPSSYIPTTTIALSRGADLQARALTGPEGTALSTQGTMVVEFSPKYDVVAVHSILSVDSGDEANSNGVYRYGTSISGRTKVASATQYDPYFGSSVPNAVYRAAYRWQLNNCRAAINGALGTADDGASTVPTVTNIGVGAYSGGDFPMGGLIYGWTIYDDAKTDAELQALSSQTKRGVGHWRTLDGTHRTAASPDKTVAIILEAECDLNTAGLDGIERVEFHYNVNGGSTTKVTKTARELLTYNCTDGSLNGLTKTWAYGFLLDCTVVAVGTIVVRATIFDNAGGVHQVPAEITVYNDTDGTDRRPSSAVVYYDHDAGDDTTGTGTTGNPFKTIRAAMNSLSGEVGGSTIRAKTRTVGCTASGSYSSSAIYTTGAWALTFEAVGSDKTIQRLTPGTFSDPQDYILGVDNTNVSRHLNLRFKDFEFVGPGPTVYANDRKVRVDEINCLYRSHAWTSSDTKPHVDYEEFGSGGIAFSTNTASVCRIYSWGGKWRGVGRGPQTYSGLFDFSVGPFLGVAIGTANNFGNDPCYTNGEVFGVRYIVGELDGLIQTNPNFTQLAGVHVTVSIQATGPHTGKMRIDATDSTPNDFGTAAQQLVGSTRWGVTVGSATTGANNGTFAALEGGLNGLGRPYCILNNASAVPEVGSAGFNMDTGALVGGARYIDAVHTDVLQIEADHNDAMFAHIRAWDCHNTRTWVGSGRTLRTCIFKNLSDGDSSGAFDFGSGSTTLLDCLFLSLSVASTAISFVGTFTGTNFVDCVWAAGTNIPTSGTFLHSNHYIVTSAGGTAPSTGVWFNSTPSNAPFDYSPSPGNRGTASGLQDAPPFWYHTGAVAASRGAWKNVATGNWSTSLGSGGGSTAKIPYLGLGVRVGFL